MNITLYRAAEDVQQKMALCTDPETGELDIDKLNAIECTFHDRGIAYVAVYKNLGLTEAALDSVITEYEAQRDKVRANRQRLKDSLMGAMHYTGTHKITSDDGVLSATFFPERDESVELDPDATFPGSLCNDPKPPTPSKTKIRAAILAGEPVAGARLVKRDRLQIK